MASLCMFFIMVLFVFVFCFFFGGGPCFRVLFVLREAVFFLFGLVGSVEVVRLLALEVVHVLGSGLGVFEVCFGF